MPSNTCGNPSASRSIPMTPAFGVRPERKKRALEFRCCARQPPAPQISKLMAALVSGGFSRCEKNVHFSSGAGQGAFYNVGMQGGRGLLRQGLTKPWSARFFRSGREGNVTCVAPYRHPSDSTVPRNERAGTQRSSTDTSTHVRRHTRTHTHAHAHTHTNTHVHTCTEHTHTHTRTHAQAHRRKRAYAHASTCTHARTHTHTHTRAHAHARAHPRAHTHTRTHTHTHTCAHAHTHAHVHAHARAHAHTHTH